MPPLAVLPRTFTELYAQRAARDQQRACEEREKKRLKKALEYASLTQLGPQRGGSTSSDGFQRMASCRRALDALDRRGWERSYHQRYFHDHFIRACARVFWKVEQQGQFAKDHQKILELNGWDTLDQEILISTPRRFGKTISVSMFAAAMVFSVPNLECSIYSTCKRISQKLLRNIQKFLEIIYAELGVQAYPVVRCNMEEIVIRGPHSAMDNRIVNSYPSKA